MRTFEYQEPYRVSVLGLGDSRLSAQAGKRVDPGSRNGRAWRRVGGICRELGTTDDSSPNGVQLFFFSHRRNHVVLAIFLLHHGREPNGPVQVFKLDAAHGEHHHLQYAMGNWPEGMEGHEPSHKVSGRPQPSSSCRLDGSCRIRKLSRCHKATEPFRTVQRAALERRQQNDWGLFPFHLDLKVVRPRANLHDVRAVFLLRLDRITAFCYSRVRNNGQVNRR